MDRWRFNNEVSEVIDRIYGFIDRQLQMYNADRAGFNWTHCSINKRVFFALVKHAKIPRDEMKTLVLRSFSGNVKRAIGDEDWTKLHDKMLSLPDDCESVRLPGVYLAWVEGESDTDLYCGSTMAGIKRRVGAHLHEIHREGPLRRESAFYKVARRPNHFTFFRTLAIFPVGINPLVVILTETVVIAHLGLFNVLGTSFRPSMNPHALELAIALRVRAPYPGTHCNRMLPISGHVTMLPAVKPSPCRVCGDSGELRKEHNYPEFEYTDGLCHPCYAYTSGNNGANRPIWLWPFYRRRHLGPPKCLVCGDTEPSEIMLLSKANLPPIPTFENMFRCRACYEFKYDKHIPDSTRPEAVWKSHLRRKFICHNCGIIEGGQVPVTLHRQTLQKKNRPFCDSCWQPGIPYSRELQKIRAQMWAVPLHAFFAAEKAALPPVSDSPPWEARLKAIKTVLPQAHKRKFKEGEGSTRSGSVVEPRRSTRQRKKTRIEESNDDLDDLIE